MITVSKSALFFVYDKYTDTLTGDTSFSFAPETVTFDELSPLVLNVDVVDSKKINVTIDNVEADALTPGIYQYSITATDIATSEVKNIPADIQIMDSSQSGGGGSAEEPLPVIIPPLPSDHAEKYYLEYYNLENDLFRVEIHQSGFTGTPTEIHGKAVLNYDERKDLFKPLIGSSLNITLEADTTATLSDLYSEKEQDFIVKLFRNGQQIFQGFLLPDGIWEDYVSDRWELTLDVTDGLSLLKNLKFVKDSGLYFDGLLNQYEAVKQCLHRIGYDLPINISLDVFYTGFSGTDTILHRTVINTERFYNENEPTDCEEVLTSILESYNASIVQQDGEWWIFRAIDLTPTTVFKKYETATGYTETVNLSTALTIGSHIDGYTIHHTNANQKKSMEASVQAFRVNYKYGDVKSILKNEKLKTYGSALGATGFIMYDLGGIVKRNPDGEGIMFTGDVVHTTSKFLETDQVLDLLTGDNIDIVWKIHNLNPTGTPQTFYVVVTTATKTLTNTGWVDTATNPDARLEISMPGNETSATFTINVTMPENGNLKTTFNARNIRANIGTVNYNPLYFDSVEYLVAKGNRKSEYHTAQRIGRYSTNVKDNKTVDIGDSASDAYVGTLYDFDGVPTTTWYRTGQTEAKALLQIMVEDNLRIAPRPMVYFEGDVYGYFSYLKLITLNNIAGKYQISKYSFDTKSNVNRTAFKEFENAYLVENTDYTVEKTFVEGNEVKVKLV